ncbi:MAG: ABC transporter ATP-binding protein [Fibrobacterota bacterium]
MAESRKPQDDDPDVKSFDRELFRKLLAFLKPYTRWVVLALFLLFAAKLLGNATPRVMQQAIDGPIARGDFGGLWVPVLVFLLLKLGAFISGFFQSILTTYIGQSIIRDLRMKLFSHILSLSMRFFGKNPVGRLMSRTVNDTDVLNELFSSGLITVFGDIFTLLFIIGFMLSLNIRLTLVSLSVLPLVAVVSWVFKGRLRSLFRQVRAKTADMNSHLQESITGMPVIHLFNQEKADAARFDTHNRAYLRLYRDIVTSFSVFYPIMELLGTVALALALWYGGVRYAGGGITIGVLVAFIQYVEDLFQPIRDLAEKYNILQNAMASSERIFKILETHDSIPEPVRPARPAVSMGKVEFRNVSFAYTADKPVLQDVSFTVEPGETVALVGATGSGKTTVVNLLNRFYLPGSGAIDVDGIPLNDYASEDLGRIIGSVSQEIFVFTDTVYQNISLGQTGVTRARVDRVARHINAARFIENLPKGYDALLNERGAGLSTGQKQLLSFARVLAHDPKILILDEATSHIDPQTEGLIQEAIDKLTKNRTSIIVAHRLSTIRHASKIVVLHHGRVAETGTHDELMRRGGLYERLYRIQFS